MGSDERAELIWAQPQPETVWAHNPPLCWWAIQCEYATSDVNQDGEIDGWDVLLFFEEWSDGIRIDRNGDGCPEADNNDDGVCDECDVWRFCELYQRGL